MPLTTTTRKPVIFTDLDGTLLDRETFDFTPALPSLRILQQKGIPLVLSSSKTRAEIELYRRGIENEHPFISENGGAVFIPKGYFVVVGELTVVDGPALDVAVNWTSTAPDESRSVS